MNKTERYVIVEGSNSAHCCFQYTIVDSESLNQISEDYSEFKEICECFDRESAELIAKALNQLEAK